MERDKIPAECARGGRISALRLSSHELTSPLFVSFCSATRVA
jgi:hypothetical protein